MNLTQAVEFLGITSRTLRLAVEQGEVEAEHPLAAGPWVFHRRALQTESCVKLVERDLSGLIHRLGMVKRADDLPPLPILPNQKACSRHRSRLCPVSVPDLSANFQ